MQKLMFFSFIMTSRILKWCFYSLQKQSLRYILSPTPVTLTLLRSSVGATPTLKGLLGMISTTGNSQEREAILFNMTHM